MSREDILIDVGIEELNKIDDDILKELTLQKISNESGIDIDLLKSKIKPVEKNIQNVEKKEKKKYTKKFRDLRK